MNRSRPAWKVKPGSWDSLNTSRLFPAANVYGIPDLPPAPLSVIPQRLIPYRTRLYVDFDPTTIGIHFWLDDYRFETTWNRP
jgi:hypothetical protein